LIHILVSYFLIPNRF